MEHQLAPHDIMALIPVMTAAGAVVTDWQGAAVNLYGDGSILAAGNADLHKKALAHLSQGL
jgi:myo-inositol-1(or 4)-monophosphatase